jgi:hypothetical protein
MGISILQKRLSNFYNVLAFKKPKYLARIVKEVFY